MVIQLLETLRACSLKATVLLGAAALTTALLRRAPASGRHAVWVAGVVSALALPLLAVVLPSWRLELLPAPPPRPARNVLSDPGVRPPENLSQPRRLPEAYRSPTGEPPRQRFAPPVLVEAPLPNGGLKARPAREADGPWSWPVSLGAVWALGATLLLLRIGVARFGARRLTRTATPVTRQGWLALHRRLSKVLGIRREVRLVESAEIALPMTWGVRRPVVLLPASAESWSTDRLELVLLHELAHVRRLDALTQLLGQLCCALYWFHPLAWLAERRMRALREYACDDFVLAAGNRASEYAGQILDIVRSLGRRDPLASATLAMARRSQLEGRLMAILDPKLPRRALGRLGQSIVTAGFVVLALPLAAFQPAAIAQAQSERGPLPRLSREEVQRRQGALPSRGDDDLPEPQNPTLAELPPTGAPPPAPRELAPVPSVPARASSGALCQAEGTSLRRSSTFDEGSTFTARRQGPGCQVLLSIEGDVAVTDEGALGIALSEGAAFVAEERAGDKVRRLEVRSQDGRMNQKWSVDGHVRSVDAEARRFAADVLAQLGPDAQPASPSHVAAPPQAPEPLAVAVEPPPAPAPPASGWSLPFEEHTAYGETLQRAKADEREARARLAQIQRDGGSDPDVSEALQEVAERYNLAGENTRQLYLDVASGIRSPDDRRDALQELLKHAPISVKTGRRLLEVASEIDSDEALGDVLDALHRIQEHGLVHGPLALDYVRACESLRSDEALADALQNLLHPSAPPEAALAALELAKRISSDDQRRKVLTEITDHQALTGELEQAYLAVASGLRDAKAREEALATSRAPGRGGRWEVRVNPMDPNWDHRRARQLERAWERRTERLARDAERMAAQARRREERLAERAARQEERARRMAERDAERERKEAERRRRAQARAEEERARATSRAELERFKEEARLLKEEARQISERLQLRVKDLKERLARELQDEELQQQLEAELEQLTDGLKGR